MVGPKLLIQHFRNYPLYLSSVQNLWARHDDKGSTYYGLLVNLF